MDMESSQQELLGYINLTGRAPTTIDLNSDHLRSEASAEPREANSSRGFRESRISITVEADSLSVRIARHFVREVMTAWGLQRESEDACLAVSELVTNSMKHANSRAIITLIRRQGGAHVRVRDEDRSFPRVRTPDDEATCGRGMHLVDALSDEWGVDPVPSGGEPQDFRDGKVVWLDIRSQRGQQAG